PRARTVGEMFWLRAARSATRPALYAREDGAWRGRSWAEIYDAAARVAAGLRGLGVAPGERVAVLGPTQPAWAIYDLGAQLAGAVSFGIYPPQSTEQGRSLLEHSEAKVAFVDDPAELENVLAAAEGLDGPWIVPWREALHREVEHKDPRITSPARFTAAPMSEA